MTTVISRLYENATAANAVIDSLSAAGFPDYTYDLITQTGEESAIDRIMAARVGRETAQALSQHLTSDRAIVVVRAPIYPMGAALTAEEITNSRPYVDVGEDVGNEYVREEPKVEYQNRVLSGHPRFLSSDMVPGSGRNQRRISDLFGMTILTRKRRPGQSVMSGGRLMSAGLLPFPVLSGRKARHSVSEHGGPILSRILGMATLSRSR